MQREAEKVGGAVHVLNGNHETMNVSGVYRYVTSGGAAEFKRWHAIEEMSARLKASTAACVYTE